MNDQIQYLPIGKIVCERQVRDHIEEASIRELASGLKEVGQLQPIRVRKVGDKYVVLDGERRFLGASYAGLQSIAAIIETQDLDVLEAVFCFWRRSPHRLRISASFPRIQGSVDEPQIPKGNESF